jgi:cell fate (sporulation/competence/biofilm development) regulator YmcA (YheA/YmcA/DUF963 family)
MIFFYVTNIYNKEVMNKLLLSEIKRVKELMSLTEKNQGFNTDKAIINENKSIAKVIGQLKTFAKSSLDNVIRKYGDEAGNAIKRLGNANTADEQFEALNSLKSIDENLAFEYRARFLSFLGENEKNALREIKELLEANIDSNSAEDIAKYLDDFISEGFDELPQGAKETLSDIVLDESPVIKNKLDELDTTVRPRPRWEDFITEAEEADELMKMIIAQSKRLNHFNNGWATRWISDGRTNLQRAMQNKKTWNEISLEGLDYTQVKEKIKREFRNDPDLKLFYREVSLRSWWKSLSKLERGLAIVGITSPGILLGIIKIGWKGKGWVRDLLNGLYGWLDEGEIVRQGGLPALEKSNETEILKAIDMLQNGIVTDEGTLKSGYTLDYSEDKEKVNVASDGIVIKIFTIEEINDALTSMTNE